MLCRESKSRTDPSIQSTDDIMSGFDTRILAPDSMEIELIPEVGSLNPGDHLVVEKVKSYICLFPFIKRTKHIHGVFLGNDPEGKYFLKVAFYTRKRRKEECKVIDLMHFIDGGELYRVQYDGTLDVKEPRDVVTIASYIAENPSHLEFHRFTSSEDFAHFCKIEWANKQHSQNGDITDRVEIDQGFFWDDDVTHNSSGLLVRNGSFCTHDTSPLL